MRSRIGDTPMHGENTPDTGTTHRWGGLAALGLCGAVAGASVAEVFASIFTHPASTVVLQPSADPLALAGAVLGLGAVLANRRRLSALLEPGMPSRNGSEDLDELTTALPLHPQSWVPVPTGPLASRSPAATSSAANVLQPAPLTPKVTGRPSNRPAESAPLRLVSPAQPTPSHAHCQPARAARRTPHLGGVRQRQAAAQ